MVEYTYDAWGYIRATSGSMAATLGKANALRYRGYVYDTETSLYYLQSRYYNPGTGRFINADALVSTGQGLLGNNMFAYCLNNPVVCADETGVAARVCISADGRIADSPWREHSPSGGDRLHGNYSSGNDYGAVADKFYTVRFIKYLSNTDEQVVLDAKYVAFYKGVPVIRINGNRSGSFGAIFLTRETNTRLHPTDVLRHEYGHTRQLKNLGVLKYVVCIFIPSWQMWGTGEYYSKPWECSADILGDVQFQIHTQTEIVYSFEYLEKSEMYGIGVWSMIR